MQVVRNTHNEFSQDGRELQKFLRSKDEYQHWIKYQIERMGLVPNVDFIIKVEMVGQRKNVKRETHWFTHEAANRIAGHSQVKSENVDMVKDNMVAKSLTLDQIFANPEAGIQILRGIAEQKKIIESQKKKIDHYEGADGIYIVTQISKEFGISPIWLNMFLNEIKVQYKRNGQWVLY